jgi:hypothetical protein
MGRQMRAEAIDRPFYCVRVGSDVYGHWLSGDQVTWHHR